MHLSKIYLIMTLVWEAVYTQIYHRLKYKPILTVLLSVACSHTQKFVVIMITADVYSLQKG